MLVIGVIRLILERINEFSYGVFSLKIHYLLGQSNGKCTSLSLSIISIKISVYVMENAKFSCQIFIISDQFL